MGRPQQYSREQAIDRALELFWQQGFYGTSLRDVENRLDMRPGSIYAAFGSKEGLLLEALTTYARRGEEALLAATASSSTPLAGLRRYLLDVARRCTDGSSGARACMAARMLTEFSHHPDSEIAACAESSLERMEALFRTVLEQASIAGEIPTDADTAGIARLLQALVLGLRTYAQRDVAEGDVRALAQSLVYCLDAVIAAAPGTTRTVSDAAGGSG